MGSTQIVRRELEYEPLPSQTRFHDTIARFKGFSGPVGSGKSMALVQEAIRLSVVNQGLLGMIGAPTYGMLRDVTQRAFFEVLEENRIPFTFRKQENLLALTDLGSEIIFRSLDNPERLRGTNLAWFGIDELTFCKEAAWLRLQARLRHPLAKELCAFGAWTPNGFDWVYQRFIGPEKLPGYEAILARPYENRHLAEDFYQSLHTSYDAKFAAQEVLGEYLSLRSGQVYYAFARAANLRTLGYHPSQQLCWSLDFNVNPMCSVICQIDTAMPDYTAAAGGHDRRLGSLNVLDEIVLPDSNTQDACEEFLRRVTPWLAKRTAPVSLNVYGDPAGNSRSTAGRSDYLIIKEFFRRQPEFRVSYHVPAAHPPVRDRVNAVNGRLCNSEGFRQCFIDPRCKRLVKDLEQVVWKADASGNTTGLMDKSNPDLTHVSDALGYLIEAEFGMRQHGGPRTARII